MRDNDPKLKPVGLLDALQRFVPAEQVTSHTEGDDSGEPSFAVEPATRSELVDTVKWVNEAGAVVFTRRPRERDGQLARGRPRVYLRGHRMARIQDLDVVSGTVTVQSGLTMNALHAYLGEKGYTTGFPTRGWRDMSVGAVIASALDSHWGPPFGRQESEVVGLGAVLPNGTAMDTRQVPARAAGPDLDRLLLGSRGRFGIVYSVTLRIYPSSARRTLAYAAASIKEGLDTIRAAFDEGLEPRAIEMLTPTTDRSWGRKRVGLTDERPVLVLVEPWGRQSSASGSALDECMREHLQRLEPPVGWNVHDGLLPSPREWRAPVVATPWGELESIAQALGLSSPEGLWLVRMSRQGAWVSLADNAKGVGVKALRERLRASYVTQPHWSVLSRTMKTRLDPLNVLNPV